MKPITQIFIQVKRREGNLPGLPGSAYDLELRALERELIELLKHPDLHKLSKLNLLNLIAICHEYRPTKPAHMLGHFALAFNRMIGKSLQVK